MTDAELRELDAMVATEVMGIPWNGGNPIPGYDGRWAWPPPYSTSIEAAWKVVERARKFVRLETEFALFANEDGTWEATFGANDYDLADTAPLAICRAALAAVRGRGLLDAHQTPEDRADLGGLSGLR